MGTIKLTMKTARTLVKKAIGISGQGLEKEKTNPVMNIYRMTTDVLEIVVSNDWLKKDGRYELRLSSIGGGGTIWLYFWPETLEEDWKAEVQQLEAIRREQCEE